MRAYTPTLVMAALAIVTQPPRPRPAAAAGEDIKALVSRQYTALSEGNAPAVQTLYADGAQLTFFAPTGPRQSGAASHVRALDEFRASNTLRWGGPRDLIVLPLGTTVAVTTAAFHAEGAGTSGQPLSIDGRQTAVWQRAGGQWKMVHEHMSAPWTPSVRVPTTAANAPQIVGEVLNTYQEAWSNGDAAALAALWDEEGDIGTLGAPVTTRGRAAVTEFWRQTISRRRSPTVVQATASTSRSVAGGVIAADGAFEYRAKNAPANAAPASVDRFALTLHEGEGGWKIATLRIAGGR